MSWDSPSFRGGKDEEDPARMRKWPAGEEENKRKRCPGSLVEEGFKTEGLINCVKIG